MTQGGSTTESYSYDAVGNRTASLGVSSYTNNSSNELTASSSASYTYDYNGNTTSNTDSTGTTDYNWDYENRLASATLPSSGGTVSFKYDPFGRRIEKISPNATSIFAYDGPDLIETVNSSGGAVARYSQGRDIDDPLAMQRGSTTSFYEADGLGSITSLSNSTGALAQTYTYDSFGNTTHSSGSLTNFFRYTSREFDTETNLYYYRSRYYDQQSGRFIREDAVKDVIKGLNFYVYVNNSPTGLVDPYGHGPLGNAIGVGWAAYGKLQGAMDWMFCGLFAYKCVDIGVDTKYAVAQAQGNQTQSYMDSTNTLSNYGTSANSMMELNRQTCFVNSPCKNFIKDCIQFAAPNPF